MNKTMLNRFREQQNGFTLIELMIVMAVFAILMSFSFINLTPLPSRTTSLTVEEKLKADLRSQQTLSMTGDTNGVGTQDTYGVHFESDGYTLFKGSSYNPVDTGNFKVELGDVNLSFGNITFPSSSVIFSVGSGDVVGYSVGSDSVDLINSLTGDTKTIKLNKYGATI